MISVSTCIDVHATVCTRASICMQRCVHTVAPCVHHPQLKMCYGCVYECLRGIDKKPVPGVDNTPLAEIARGNAAEMWGDWGEDIRAAAPSSKL